MEEPIVISWETYNTVMRDRYRGGVSEGKAVGRGIIERLCAELGEDDRPYIKELYGKAD